MLLWTREKQELNNGGATDDTAAVASDAILILS